MLLSIALGIPPADIAVPLSQASLRVGQTPELQARAIARMVGGVISYSRWPNQSDPVHICTMGATRFAQRLNDAATTAGRPVSLRQIAPGSSAATQNCDILYLGAVGSDQRLKAISAIHGQPILSFAEGDPACRGGAMFCLAITGDTMTFRLNVDAISRGTVRVDPRVLRLFDPNREAA